MLYYQSTFQPHVNHRQALHFSYMYYGQSTLSPSSKWTHNRQATVIMHSVLFYHYLHNFCLPFLHFSRILKYTGRRQLNMHSAVAYSTRRLVRLMGRLTRTVMSTGTGYTIRKSACDADYKVSSFLCII